MGMLLRRHYNVEEKEKIKEDKEVEKTKKASKKSKKAGE